MIEVKDLTKKFGEVKAVDNISFKIEKGEIVGFLGPNGAGKTTTMRILTGFWPATSGEVKIAGFDIFENPLEVRKRIGYLPENTPLYEEMKVAEFLNYSGAMKDISSEKIKERIDYVLSSCGLKDKINQEISTLSKGYRQRVGLAQALLADPEILILDEPTSGLDPNQIVEIRELIKKIGKEKTVILSSHILPEVEATCSRVLIINKGKIVASGTPEELKSQAVGKSFIALKIEARPDKDISADLRQFNEISNINKSFDGQYLNLQVETKPGTDLRRELVKFLVANQWNLVEIYRQEATLENIFADLTKM